MCVCVCVRIGVLVVREHTHTYTPHTGHKKYVGPARYSISYLFLIEIDKGDPPELQNKAIDAQKQCRTSENGVPRRGDPPEPQNKAIYAQNQELVF